MPAASSSHGGIRRVEKENLAPRSKSRESFGEEDEVPKKSRVPSKSGSSQRPMTSSRNDETEATSSSSASKRLAAVTAQRDLYAKQFEELSKLRATDTEKLFDRYKQKAELQANSELHLPACLSTGRDFAGEELTTAQNGLIANLTALNEKLSSKVSSLEKALSAAKATPPAPVEAPRPVDPKEVRALKEDVRKLQKEVAARDQKVLDLEKELKTEIEHSRHLQSQKNVNPLAASISTTTEEAEKDAASLALYEEITGLGLVNVKIKPVKHGKETVFSCIHTVDGRSVSYKLRKYLMVNPDAAERKAKPWIKMLHYVPESLDKEIDQDLLSRLGLFRTEVTMPFEQVGGLFDNLKARISRDGIFERFEGE